MELSLDWAQIRAATTLAERAQQLLGEMLCAWHGDCHEQADGTGEHPVLGSVAICAGCAGADGVHLAPFRMLVNA